MRPTIAIVTTMLILILASGPLLAQTGDEWRWWLYSLQMFDVQIGWAVVAEGYGGVSARGAETFVVRTTDGGLHWRIVPHKAGDVRAISPLSAWLPGPSLHTPDGGQTWRKVNVSVGGVTSPLGFAWLDFISDRDWWVLRGSDLHRSTNGGETWNKVGSVKDTGPLTVLNATTAWILVDKPDEFHVLVTHDGGYTWRQPKLPVPPQLKDTWRSVDRPYAFPASLGGVLPVYFENDELAADRWGGVFFYVTRDGGRTWRHTTPVTLPIQPDLDFLVSWSFADVNHGWVSDGYALYVTSDSGARWTKTQPQLPEKPLGKLYSISPQVGWATGNPMMKPFLLKTVDGGHTWTSVPYAIVRQ